MLRGIEYEVSPSSLRRTVTCIGLKTFRELSESSLNSPPNAPDLQSYNLIIKDPNSRGIVIARAEIFRTTARNEVNLFGGISKVNVVKSRGRSFV